jgi:hypothetical protein
VNNDFMSSSMSRPRYGVSSLASQSGGILRLSGFARNVEGKMVPLGEEMFRSPLAGILKACGLRHHSRREIVRFRGGCQDPSGPRLRALKVTGRNQPLPTCQVE